MFNLASGNGQGQRAWGGGPEAIGGGRLLQVDQWRRKTNCGLVVMVGWEQRGCGQGSASKHPIPSSFYQNPRLVIGLTPFFLLLKILDIVQTPQCTLAWSNVLS
uniref:Uncharacterized protein n=1 Tax=Micrurus lemniscatus lemniscatus TaxID=129467 RepID=A0A2D4I7B6_MICLE